MTDTASLTSVLDPNNAELAQYRTQAPELLALAQTLEITTEAGLQQAAEYTKTSSAACKAIKAMFAKPKRALDEAKRQIAELESTILDGFRRADEILRAKVTAYHGQRLEAARAEQRQREEVERRRREDEQVAQAARLETLSKATGDLHFQHAAEQVLNAPVRVPTAPVTVPKVDGMSFREETGVLIADQDALVAAVAAGRVDRKALLPNLPWLRTEAKQRGTALRDGDELFPGVLVTKTPDVTVRTR